MVRSGQGLRRARNHGLDGHAGVPRAHEDRGTVRVPRSPHDAQADAQRRGRSVFPARFVAVLLPRASRREVLALRSEHVALARQERRARDAARVLFRDCDQHAAA